jgi:tRNA nucleotidyltransferase (CCA-adding enzyme)
LKVASILKLLIEFNALREGTLFKDALQCCYADANGKGVSRVDYPQMNFLVDAAELLKGLCMVELLDKYEGKKLGEMIKQLRIQSIKDLLVKYSLRS